MMDSDIRTAVLWKFGHLWKKQIPSQHEQLIALVRRQWPVLCSTLTGPAAAVFNRLDEAIGGGNRFVTITFLLHLLGPAEVVIIDQHNFRAMNHYLRTVRPGWPLKRRPSTYEDLATLSSFVREIRARWETVEAVTVPDERKLDRFLMMYGKALKPDKRKHPTTPMPKSPLLDQPNTRGAQDSNRNTRIMLPYGGAKGHFEANELVRYLIESGRNYIIQGQVNCRLAAHPKPGSLDVWLRRNFADNPDTKQAVNQVVQQLVSTGLFEEGRFLCPDSGQPCKGIRLV
ncbi:MAG: hypothetical protein HY238_06565 [Acidobacteria bacterium]|nr:hypothetical protein [Acidobacteriota bacterium]